MDRELLGGVQRESDQPFEVGDRPEPDNRQPIGADAGAKIDFPCREASRPSAADQQIRDDEIPVPGRPCAPLPHDARGRSGRSSIRMSVSSADCRGGSWTETRPSGLDKPIGSGQRGLKVAERKRLPAVLGPDRGARADDGKDEHGGSANTGIERFHHETHEARRR